MVSDKTTHEWQFDGLVGPTHHYAGLAQGNLAAKYNAGTISNPRQAALQGLEKMRFVQSLGMRQAFLPPHFRPLVTELKRLGFEGTTIQILEKTRDYSVGLLSSIFSSSFMWTANAATVTASRDTADQKLHITPANMASHYHRAIETEFTQRMLSKIFHNTDRFSVNRALFTQSILGDEGAANHMVVNSNNDKSGVHLFVYGDNHGNDLIPQRYIPRQRRFASESVARLHKIADENCIFLQQSPAAIDQGVFHNDVIAMNTTRHMIVHEKAFIPQHQLQLKRFFENENDLRLREVKQHELSLGQAVATYFFNSQFLDLGEGHFVIIAPSESAEHSKAYALFEQLKVEGLVSDVHYRDLRESMRNGGGPACLRLRVPMTAEEEAAIHPGIILSEERYHALVQWVNTYYRDRLQVSDLCDPQFFEELKAAYRALEVICDLPGLYDPYWVE